MGWEWCQCLIWLGSDLIGVVSLQWNPLFKTWQVVSEPMVKNWLRRVQVPVSKVFLARVPGKRAPLRWTAIREGVLVWLEMRECFRWRGSVPMWLKGLTVRNPSVILSLTLARNEKVEHYIRIKTHKLIALRFWVESGVSVLCG